ncbi:MAG TPA: D-glycerate dehydrogenase [Vicinamibacterales bacterium]|nr:D-glycerate dehydrogenase [Acidobacteriota bacterium]HOC17042.1 D-glycerate dehydrogenase [Vicinamibacterales bacterium]
MKPRVLLTRRVPATVYRRLEEACEVDLHGEAAAIPGDELRRRVADKDALLCLLTDRVDREVLEAAPRLKIVANIAVGYDNVDVASAAARGIVVTNTPEVLTEATAELTWALILAATRRIAEGDRAVRAGRWGGWALDYMLGMQLSGKQLGVIGLGRIGTAVASRAPAFGMSVAAASLPGQPVSPSGGVPLPPIVTVPLDELLRTSDVVTLHVPLTPDTRHLIDRPRLARMKRSAYLVNTSRGPVVDEEALAWALGERLIAGAALDVYEREPLVHPALLPLDNVVLAPHLGSATTETRTAMADLAVSNVLEVLAGRPPLTPVHP